MGRYRLHLWPFKNILSHDPPVESNCSNEMGLNVSWKKLETINALKNLQVNLSF